MEFLESLRRLEEDVDNYDDFEHLPVHAALEKRFRNTLYLGKASEGISLPVADVAVDLFQNAAEKNLGTFTRRHVAKFNRNGQLNPSSSMLGMMYARRLKQRKSDYLQKVTSTELFLVSMMLATKFLCDEGEEEEIFSDEWADSANMDVKKVNELEREFLDALNWDLYVKPDEFYEFLQQMEIWIALNEGHQRGWFSYSDMNVLMGHSDWYSTMSQLLDQSMKVLGICLAVYTLCSATLCWSLLVMQHHSAIPGMSLDAANYSHVFRGVRPLKTTQVASHQSEILLPPLDLTPEVNPSPVEDLSASDAFTPCPSCRQCCCPDAQVHTTAQGTVRCVSEYHWSKDVDPLDLASCQKCLARQRAEDFWLRNQIAGAHLAMISFYQALLAAYYDTPERALARRNDTHNSVQGRSHQINRSAATHGEHQAPSEHALEVKCPRLLAGLKEGSNQKDLDADGDSDWKGASHWQCSICDNAKPHGTLRESTHMLLPASVVGSTVGFATSTIPIIVA